MRYELEHLDVLESESIHIFREVVGTLERTALLFSGGKDSAVMLHIARKAFWPARLPMPLVHIDTGENFPEVIEYRDRTVASLEARLIVGRVQDDIDAGRVVEDKRSGAGRNRLQTVTLLRTIEENRFSAMFGGARRDEEKARAKERVLSFRDEFGQWDPKNQRPELWNLYNGRHAPGEHMRVFPLSNWTELDVWQYVLREGIDLPSIYFAHERPVVRRGQMVMAINEFVPALEGEDVFPATVRYRTVGDATCTAAVESKAATVEDIISEVAASRITERGATRADDKTSEAAMEDRKREGYF